MALRRGISLAVLVYCLKGLWGTMYEVIKSDFDGKYGAVTEKNDVFFKITQSLGSKTNSRGGAFVQMECMCV